MNWKKLYIQKETADGDATTGNMVDTISRWGMYCGEVGWMVGGESKDLPSNDWGDEDGVEEWMPEEGIPLKAYEISLTFYCKGSAERCLERATSFRDYLTGRDGSGCWMRLYSEYSESGKSGVRFVSMDDNPDFAMTHRGLVGKIKVTFKITRPQSNVKLAANAASLVER